MSQNSRWFQKYKPSKLEGKKTLTACEPNVSHFKGLIIFDLNPRAQGRDSTFTFCHALLKNAILYKGASRKDIRFWGR